MQKYLKNKRIILGLLIIGIVLITVGGTFAWFSYVKDGTKQHTISSGSIKFHYSEDSQGITLNDALPMTDEQGMATDYFEFSIDSKTSDTVDIPYYITARRSGTGTNMDNIVKVYLTKVVNGVEQPVEVVTGKTIAKVSELGSYINNDGINIPSEEHLLYTDKVFAGTSNYNQVYRLRMWIDERAEFIIQQEGEEDIYPYNGKTYTLKVNVYGSAVEINQSAVELRANTNINDIAIDNNILTTTSDTFEGTATMPAGETTMIKQITVNTENPNSTVTVEKLNGTTGAIVEEVKRLSTNLTLNLELGINKFRITVTPEDPNANIHVYNLKITVSYPSYEVSMMGNNVTFDSDNINITYGSTNTVTVTPASGYYVSNGICTNGYTITGLTTDGSVTGVQTVTIDNGNNQGSSICTFAVHGIASIVTLNNQSATTAGTASVTGTYGNAMPSITVPSKTGHTFGGYYTETNGGGTKYYNADGSSAKTWDKTGATTLYAKWTANSYEVTLSGSNVTLGNSKINVNYGSTNTVTVIPASGYYISNGSCTNGYTITGLSTGTSATSAQTVTIDNNNNVGKSTCTFATVCGYSVNQVFNFSYTGGQQTFTPKCDGRYRLETWGAQGGTYNSSYPGGYGGYSVGEISLSKSKAIYINVGGSGTTSAAPIAGGYNGGGSVTITDGASSSGGGATHIATVSGQLKNLSSYRNTGGTNISNEILIVSGAGGGGCNQTTIGGTNFAGGHAGGYTSADIQGYTTRISSTVTYAYGANQSGPNSTTTYAWSDYSNNVGGFGYGGDTMGELMYSSAGGSGWIGGGGSFGIGGGAGGVSYIANPKLTNKKMFCYGCTESTATATYTVSTTGSSSLRDTTNCSSGYSANPVAKCAKSGHGYARITYLGE